MALRSDVVEAAGARSSERRRAWGDSSKRASEPDAEPPPRARWSTRYSPRTYVPLTRRLRRAVAVCPEEPGLTRLRPPSHPSSATSPSSTRSPRRLARRRLARRPHCRFTRRLELQHDGSDGRFRARGGRRRKLFGRALRVCRPSLRHSAASATSRGSKSTTDRLAASGLRRSRGNAQPADQRLPTVDLKAEMGSVVDARTISGACCTFP